MPVVDKLTIYNCSSEDQSHPSSNLLRQNAGKKWISKNPNESSVSVTFQLPSPMQICGIDIGNEWSAFIEVLGAPNKGAKDDDYKQILLASSLMSVPECRNEENPNRVRCFGKSSLVSDSVDQKWQLIKIICTQPYNRTVKYGLSFVKFHTPALESINENEISNSRCTDDKSTPSTSFGFGKFRIRQDSTDSDSNNSSTLFSRWKQSKNESKVDKPNAITAAAAIRDSSSSPSVSTNKYLNAYYSNKSKSTSKPSKKHSDKSGENDPEDDAETVKPKNRNRVALLYDDEDEKPIEKFDKKIDREKEKQKEQQLSQEKKQLNKTTGNFQDFLDDKSDKSTKTKTPIKKHKSPKAEKKTSSKYSPIVTSSASKRPSSSRNDDNNLSRSQSNSSNNDESIKRPKIEKKPEKQKVYRPFNKLLSDVVFAISGIQNPLRAELRQKALELGAKYKPDWDNSCTHLICAFKNTPKYNQVCGHGKIVAKTWIPKCHSTKKRIPWRRHALDSDEEIKTDSEEEIADETMRPSIDDNIIELNDSPKKPSSQPSTSSVSQRSKSNVSNHSESSEIDTEDEIDRIMKKQQKTTEDASTSSSSANRNKNDQKDIYDKTTEEDERGKISHQNNGDDSISISPLPEFFDKKSFYLCDNLSSVDNLKLTRFINVYKGEIIDTATAADYVITNQILSSTGNEIHGEIVKPLWIYECNDMECLLPTKRYKF